MIRKVEMMAEKLVREYPQKTPDSSLWIAGKLYQEKNKIKKEFVVGDNKNNTGFLNRHLTSDSKYWLTVVTETTAGSYRELIASKSMVYVSTPPSNSVWWVVVVVVVVVVLVVVLLALTVFIWRIRYRKKTSVIAVHPPSIHYNHHNGLLSSESSLTSNNTSLPEARLSSEQDLVYKNVQEVYANKQEEVYENEQAEVFENEVREDEQEEVQFPDQDVTTEVIYSNVSHKIPRAQAETYLARIIHSPGIEEEFKSVPAILDKSCSHGKLQDNLKKNRYRNNLPYDDTRVKLPLINDLPHSDYINANYVQGHTRAEAFIATQGPKDFNADTVGDFWRMIWHTRCSLIVMVASLMENGKVKVARYWPEGEQLLHKDDLQVKLISTEVKMDFIIRTLQISKDKETREVRHYQYTSWPDHGVPQNPYGLAQMINNLTLEATTGPVTVHCSAGIGRTGTVLLVLLMLDQLNTSGYIDPHLALVHLREGRPRLVENTAQYTFGHQVLLEVLSGVTTSYKCSNFSEALEVLRLPQPPSNTSIMHQQFQKLKNLPKDMSFKFGKNPACAHLNRSQDILPADNRMVFLQNFGDNLESQYINVVRVNGMDMKNAYLAGEHPQQHTLDSIWRLVYERRVPLWVVIHTLPQNHPDYPDVVPSEEWQTISNMKIRLTGQQAFNNFTEYYVQITVPKSRVPAPHTCVLLLMEGWPYTDPLPASPDPLLGVVERVASLGTGHSASLFTCKDGVTGCGVMMALLHLVARIQLLQEVDVYRVVLNIIYDRPQFITTIEQYDFLHTAGASFLASFREYGNFN
ncbi:receptor-type tyrosine-protein phosphatase epsilon [Cherax quadricarinatus]|uniref:receptor-type tyrosine-protein phosphatase epsilon n=1 Tax=Cherax quadricarinatus TaxID=27406 RepID=UPI00387EE6C1